MRAQLEEARQMLMDRKRSLARRLPDELARAREALQPQPAWEDAASGREEVSVLATLTESEQREIGEIDAALARIDAGHYGSCEVCGATIGRGRLRALPETRLCLDCSAQLRSRR
jgi:DnaK suppressor protein